ncbi:hypothetical protein HYV81_05075 [Candidatus Woesearchaeota archaeon]|nr:hypothetical protein [Candidatus Woesearchaeota archaeon]
MSQAIISNVLGIFVVDQQAIIDKKLFNSHAEYEARQHYIAELKKKHKQASETHDLRPFLHLFKAPEFHNAFHERNIELTKQALKQSVTKDQLIIQAANSVADLDKIINQLAKRLREWYELYNPETSKAIEDHEKFIEAIIKKSKQELLQQFSVKQEMGAALEADDVHALMNLAHHTHELYRARQALEKYSEKLLKEIAPNLHAIAGTAIAAKLLMQAGSLERLSILPASTIQILGAEKAMFRHLTTKHARMPKYGILFQHPLIAKVPQQDRGKAARGLADKLALAAKVDRFKGKPLAAELIKDLEMRFGSWK